jgi:hypothetical protein
MEWTLRDGGAGFDLDKLKAATLVVHQGAKSVGRSETSSSGKPHDAWVVPPDGTESDTLDADAAHML